MLRLTEPQAAMSMGSAEEELVVEVVIRDRKQAELVMSGKLEFHQLATLMDSSDVGPAGADRGGSRNLV